jgi:hypothetical protein
MVIYSEDYNSCYRCQNPVGHLHSRISQELAFLSTKAPAKMADIPTPNTITKFYMDGGKLVFSTPAGNVVLGPEELAFMGRMNALSPEILEELWGYVQTSDRSRNEVSRFVDIVSGMDEKDHNDLLSATFCNGSDDQNFSILGATVLNQMARWILETKFDDREEDLKTEANDELQSEHPAKALPAAESSSVVSASSSVAEPEIEEDVEMEAKHELQSEHQAKDLPAAESSVEEDQKMEEKYDANQVYAISDSDAEESDAEAAAVAREAQQLADEREAAASREADEEDAALIKAAENHVAEREAAATIAAEKKAAATIAAEKEAAATVAAEKKAAATIAAEKEAAATIAAEKKAAATIAAEKEAAATIAAEKKAAATIAAEKEAASTIAAEKKAAATIAAEKEAASTIAAEKEAASTIAAEKKAAATIAAEKEAAVAIAAEKELHDVVLECKSEVDRLADTFRRCVETLKEDELVLNRRQRAGDDSPSGDETDEDPPHSSGSSQWRQTEAQLLSVVELSRVTRDDARRSLEIAKNRLESAEGKLESAEGKEESKHSVTDSCGAWNRQGAGCYTSATDEKRYNKGTVKMMYALHGCINDATHEANFRAGKLKNRHGKEVIGSANSGNSSSVAKSKAIPTARLVSGFSSAHASQLLVQIFPKSSGGLSEIETAQYEAQIASSDTVVSPVTLSDESKNMSDMFTQRLLTLITAASKGMDHLKMLTSMVSHLLGLDEGVVISEDEQQSFMAIVMDAVRAVLTIGVQRNQERVCILAAHGVFLGAAVILARVSTGTDHPKKVEAYDKNIQSSASALVIMLMLLKLNSLQPMGCVNYGIYREKCCVHGNELEYSNMFPTATEVWFIVATAKTDFGQKEIDDFIGHCLKTMVRHMYRVPGLQQKKQRKN